MKESQKKASKKYDLTKDKVTVRLPKGAINELDTLYFLNTGVQISKNELINYAVDFYIADLQKKVTEMY